MLAWLMEGDPVVRFQAMRDLLDAPEAAWKKEQARIPLHGWGRQFLDAQDANGNWPSSRWTGNVWTLTLLAHLGAPADTRLADGFQSVAGSLMPKGAVTPYEVLKHRMDLCHLGFWLRIGSRFSPRDLRLPMIADAIYRMQFADGGWNCHIRTKPTRTHSSFNTTFNVLEGLREAADAGVIERQRFESAEARAMEFMLQHRMYRSDKTGEVVKTQFVHLTYPSYWHYNVLRGLDYMRLTPAIKDMRLDDPLDLIESRRQSNGRWIVERRIPGRTLFDMEKMGQDSRLNTLRALRVLRAAGRT